MKLPSRFCPRRGEPIVGFDCIHRWAGASIPLCESPAIDSRRYALVDLARGYALLVIFFDHITDDFLGQLTPHAYGFSDAAEIFVFLSGFASMLAYRVRFERHGTASGFKLIALRCLRLYAFHVALLAASLAIVTVWIGRINPTDPTAQKLAHELDVTSMDKLLVTIDLQSLPSYLDILPLYIVLLLALPLIHAGMRRSLPATAVISGAIWLGVNLHPTLNLPNANIGTGWYFNPLAWQFLFVIGAGAAVIIERNNRVLPQSSLFDTVCWAYLAFSFFAVSPWVRRNIPSLHLIAIDAPEKSTLSILRLLHVLAMVYLALSFPKTGDVARSGLFAPIILCGRHSLEVFAVGSLLSLLGRLIVSTYGHGWAIQLGINIIGPCVMFVVALVLERTTARKRPRTDGHLGSDQRSAMRLPSPSGPV